VKAGIFVERKILIIISDPVWPDLLRKNRVASGYQVFIVKETGKEVDSLLKMGTPDLVLVDIIMPCMKGIETSINICRKHDVPVIMLTSYRTDKEKFRGIDLSTEDKLSDSFDVVELMNWIKETLARNITAPCGCPAAMESRN
jgi:DNA-binding response OmpR family regulator